jgi:hypothetical protein
MTPDLVLLRVSLCQRSLGRLLRKQAQKTEAVERATSNNRDQKQQDQSYEGVFGLLLSARKQLERWLLAGHLVSSMAESPTRAAVVRVSTKQLIVSRSAKAVSQSSKRGREHDQAQEFNSLENQREASEEPGP